MKTKSLMICLTWPSILLFCADFASTAPSLQETEAPFAKQALSTEWEEARQIWNGVRTVKKQLSVNAKREERSTTSTPIPAILDDYLANVSAPAYVKELYRNLSLQDSDKVDATTIRSLPASREGDGEQL